MQDAYFQQLNQVLKVQGSGEPQLIVDVHRFDANLQRMKQCLPSGCRARLVVKSLASLPLLQHAAKALETDVFMVFHVPHLFEVLAHFPQADILFGKPMPVRVLTNLSLTQLKTLHSVQWLIDCSERLAQYLVIAQQHQLQLKVNLEIDVGLHRGGFTDVDHFRQSLQMIEEHPEYLSLSGLMGYDAHIAKLPRPFFSEDRLYHQSQQRYQQFITVLQNTFPTLDLNNLSLNGAGSASIWQHHRHGTVCNDLSFGSLLLKPYDFEMVGLESFEAALWIATPVLKVISRLQLPALEFLSTFRSAKAVFCYGGYWRGHCVYPQGAHPHRLYGRSSNQEIWQLPRHTELDVDDYLLIQPSQSESMIPQFTCLYAYCNERLMPWSTFRE